jgi:hypothetical protein
MLNEEHQKPINSVITTHKVSSAFFGETTIFHYPAVENTNQAVMVLKGLYGQHRTK